MAIGRQPDAQEALDRGRAIDQVRLAAKLHGLAMDGNGTGVFFVLKASQSYGEGEPLEGGGSTVQANTSPPSAMTNEDYRKLVDVTPRSDGSS